MAEHYVSQAQFRVVVRDESEWLTTVLGSCIAACLWDPVARIGGMNHFLLPDRATSGLAAMSAGSTSMEVLINETLKAGASRAGLRARLFGGGAVVKRLSDIGARNIAFAREFLQAEGIPIMSESVGGDLARRVRFWPATGVAQHRFVKEIPVEAPPPPPPISAGVVELF